MYKHLFFDDTRLLGRENLKRLYGTPQLCGHYIDPRVICGYGWGWAFEGEIAWRDGF